MVVNKHTPEITEQLVSDSVSGYSYYTTSRESIKKGWTGLSHLKMARRILVILSGLSRRISISYTVAKDLEIVSGAGPNAKLPRGLILYREKLANPLGMTCQDDVSG